MATILLVEDDDTYRVTLQVALHRAGHRVCLAASIREVSVVLASMDSPPDMVILDWFLPDATGQRAIAWLRGRGCLAPILVLTATESLDVVRRQALAAGASLFLSKAISLSDLLATIERLVAGELSWEGYPLRLGGTTLTRLEPPYPAVQLTRQQANVVQALLDQPPGQPLSAEKIAGRIMVYDPEQRARRSQLVAKRISRLRPRLALLGVHIRAERWQGYWLEVTKYRNPERSAT